MGAPKTDSGTQSVLLNLGDLDAGMGELAGGKAANLGELISAGVQVPAGFCVTTHTYAKSCDNLAGFDDLVTQLDSAAHEEIPVLARRIRELVSAIELPSDLASSIKAAYGRLGDDTPVAVRSSATAEDLPHASFAGQQDTYLNIVGSAALLDAITRCWSSLWTDRAVFYRASNDIDHRKVKLAVVIQRMVDAVASGVLFTANPVTGRRGEAVIDANTGLGESVVSGAVNPDHFVIDTATSTITQRRAGDKKLSVWSKPGGGTETRAGSSALSLTDDQVRHLASQGSHLEKHYGVPQDIEWAVDVSGNVWITQSRPITTLFPLPANETAGLRMYLGVNVAQGVYRPLTPLGASIMQFASGSLARQLGYSLPDRFAGAPALIQDSGWLFMDITPLSRNRWGRVIVPRMLEMMEARAGQIFGWLLDDPRLSVQPGSTRAAVRVFGRVFRKTKLPLRVIKAWLRPARARAEAFRMAEDIRAELRISGSSHPRARLARVHRGFLDVTAPKLPRLLPTLMAGVMLSRFLPKLLGSSVTAEEIQVVLRGIPHNITTEMDLELWQLAEEVARDAASAESFMDNSSSELVTRFRAGTLPRTVQTGLTSFLDRNGHRAVAEIDTGMPRWADDPTPIIDTLAGYLSSSTDGHSAVQRYEQGVREAEDMVRRIVARLRKKNPPHAWIAHFAMDRVRQLAGLREMPKYCIVLTIAHARRQLLEVGESLASEGALSAPDDVLFLSFKEISQAVDGVDVRSLAAERRQQHDIELRRKHIPRMLLSDGTEPETMMPSSERDGALTGVSASAGTISGTAKVVLDPAGARLAPGEILVAPSTDPGWTPLFLTAGGLVMEMGGPNSHGATVAREYGIPAVVGVPGATQRIVDGQRITVNGSAGTVELH